MAVGRKLSGVNGLQLKKKRSYRQLNRETAALTAPNWKNSGFNSVYLGTN